MKRPAPRLTGLNPATQQIDGTEGDDLLFGTPEDDALFGLSGNDIVLGLGGQDFLYGDFGALSYESGDDVAQFGGDLFIDGSANPTYWLGETMFGDAADVALKMTKGQDLTMATGDDVFIVTAQATTYVEVNIQGDIGNLNLTHWNDKGGVLGFTAGNDTILSASGNGATVYATGDAELVTIDSTADAGQVNVVFGDDTMIGVFSAVGDAYSVTVTGGGQAEVFIQAGNDLILLDQQDGIGALGDFDTLYFDTRDQGALTILCGNDTLVGSAASDDYTGDFNGINIDNVWYTDHEAVTKGADLFVFDGQSGDDRVLDFDLDRDTLLFRGLDGADASDIAWTFDTGDDPYSLLDLTAVGGGTIEMWHVTEAQVDELHIVFA